MTSKIDSESLKGPIFIGSLQNFGESLEKNDYIGLISVVYQLNAQMFKTILKGIYLLSLWQQSLEAMDEATKLLFIKDLLFCRLPVDDFDFFEPDMVAAAATAALLFEIKA